MSDERDPLECLAEEFSERRRQGEELTIEAFAAEHPDQAADIRSLFPAIAAMERVKVRHPQRRDGRVAMTGQVPARLGDYRILHEIGRGGMGVVYEAQQVSLGRRVAVKVLPRQSLLAGKALRRFEREARTAAKLHHTNIVPVFGIGEQEGYHYIVMQLIVGVGLDEVLTELRRATGTDGSPTKTPRSHRAHAKAAALLSQDFSLLKGVTPSPSSPGSGLELFETDHRSLPTEDGEVSPTVDPQLVTSDAVRSFSPNAERPNPRAGDVAETGWPEEDQRLRGESSDHQRSHNERSDAPPNSSPRSAATVPFSPLYWRNVARIGLQVAEALEYAHEQGTLHRDIKPGNLLLDAHATVWVADFGLAKLSEQDDVSQTGDIVGTLNYIAPEALSGHTDRRSDVYSLGLTLYELLTLRSAYGGKTHARVLEEIRRASPRRPSHYQPQVPRDLETIVLKAIAAEPDKRYATAGALAEDLHRFLDDLPIHARRASLVEHAWRWCRRNRLVASLSALVLVLLVLYASLASYGFVKMTDLANKAKQAAQEEAELRKKADEQREAAEEQRKRAEGISQLAVQALDNIYARFVPEHAVNSPTLLMDGSDSTEDDDASGGDEEPSVFPLRSQPTLSNETAVFLEEMLQFYDRFAEQDELNVDLRISAAVASRKVGDVQFLLGKPREAEGAYRRALEQYAQLPPLESRAWSDRRIERARAQNGLAMSLKDQGQMREAGMAHLEALQALRQPEPAPTPQTEATPGRSETVDARDSQPVRERPFAERLEEARTLYYLSRMPPWRPGGRNERRGGRRRPAAGPEMPPPEMPRPDMAPPPGPPTSAPAGAPGGLLGGLRQLRERLPIGPPPPRPEDDYLAQAISALESLVTEFPQEPESRFLLANAYRSRGDNPWEMMPQNLPEQQRAVELLEHLVRDYPQVADYRHELCRALAGLRMVPRFDLKPNASSDDLLRAVDLSRGLISEHPNIPRFRETHALLLQQQGLHALQAEQWADAEKQFRESLEMLRNLTENYPEDFRFRMAQGGVFITLAHALEQQATESPEKGREAHAIYEQAIQQMLQERRHGRRVPDFVRNLLWTLHDWQAANLRRMGENDAADEVARRAAEFKPRERREGPPGPPPPQGPPREGPPHEGPPHEGPPHEGPPHKGPLPDDSPPARNDPPGRPPVAGNAIKTRD